MNTCLAVDIGGTKIAAALICDGEIQHRMQVNTPSSTQTDEMDSALNSLLHPLIKQANFVAVASTGIIDKGILSALNPVNLGGLNHYPLQQSIEKITQLPVFVINDAQAAAWAEFQTCSVPNMAFITVSTGVGAGLVINQKLLTGAHGIAGHAGHMLADPNGPLCGCGRQGCVESIASGTAIGNAGKTHWGKQCDSKMVFKKHIAGDNDASKIIHASAKAIANLIADLTISLDIELVRIGGSVGLAADYKILVEQYLLQMPSVYRPQISTAQNSADAGLIGAALWAKSQYLLS